MGNTNIENPPLERTLPFVRSLPEGRVRYAPILERQEGVKMKSGCVTLQPGEEVGEHTTGDHEELVIVLEGSGEIEAEGMERTPIRAGQVAYNPPCTRHNVFNTSDAPLRYIFVVSEI